MSRPLRHLPVLQNWDCHGTGTCCKGEYQVTITEAEKKRIEAQGWDPDKDLGGRKPVRRVGLLWGRRWVLNHKADGSCVFLSDQGRCRIHEKHGYKTKPLPCRLFPFVLVPLYDRWAVGLRYACPSAAANKGRPLTGHDQELREFALELAEREGLGSQPDGALTPPPRLQGWQRAEWPDLLRILDTLLAILQNRKASVERRLRQCLSFTAEMRKARLDDIKGARLSELLQLLQGVAEAETPADNWSLPRPGWVGRILFRQAAALFTRKDHGPNCGLASRGRFALMGAAWRFVRGKGLVPRMHRAIPEVIFAHLEEPAGIPPAEVEEILERYYVIKVGSLQFCPPSFGLSFWEAFESLVVTYPILMWVARMYRDRSRADAVIQALTIVDDHVGFNRVLRGLRQRLSFRILASTGQLARLIAWYSR
jgi:lysine-N-methylase